MKTRIEIISGDYGYIHVPKEVFEFLGWKNWDTLALDISMVHKGMLCIEKSEKNVGEKVV